MFTNSHPLSGHSVSSDSAFVASLSPLIPHRFALVLLCFTNDNVHATLGCSSSSTDRMVRTGSASLWQPLRGPVAPLCLRSVAVVIADGSSLWALLLRAATSQRSGRPWNLNSGNRNDKGVLSTGHAVPSKRICLLDLPSRQHDS